MGTPALFEEITYCAHGFAPAPEVSAAPSFGLLLALTSAAL